MIMCRRRTLATSLGLLMIAIVANAADLQLTQNPLPVVRVGGDSDQDGLPDSLDACPVVGYQPEFDWHTCPPTDANPGNDAVIECRARERIINTLLSSGVFTTHIAFAVVKNGAVHFADAFSYVGQGQYVHDPAGIHRLYRVGSTSKSIVAVAARALAESGELSLTDFVSDDDASRIPSNGERTLRQLLSHQGAFKVDNGAIHLFCYPADLPAFWSDPDDLVSPHYDSAVYGNLGGGFEYSAFNYSLAGAYMAKRTGEKFAEILQTRIFDAAGMCTASLDGPRAVATAIGTEAGVSQAAVMHVGPYINYVSPTDPRCEDNFYSSDAVYGDPYTWQVYKIDEAAAEARDPAGGVIASVLDLAHFGKALLAAYQGLPSVVSQAGIKELWGATSNLGCSPNCPYEPFYGIGFFTDSQPGARVKQVGHGGSRAGFASGFVLRPEKNLAICVLANADVSTVTLSNLCKTILDDFQTATDVDPDGGGSNPTVQLAPIDRNPLSSRATTRIRFELPADAWVQLEVFDVRGRSVSRIANRAYAAGDHMVAWSPSDARLMPGVYFIRLASLGTVSARKLVISR
jgi:CubicO group peptidase (beta-lactamase class C family)